MSGPFFSAVLAIGKQNGALSAGDYQREGTLCLIPDYSAVQAIYPFGHGLQKVNVTGGQGAFSGN